MVLRARSVAHQLQVAGHARRMRFAPTESEAALWALLRGEQLGAAFRRQVVVGRYIVDFYAPAVRLAVEVDGGYHARCRVRDARRDRALERAGVVVLHVTAAEVLRAPEAAAVRVREALAARRQGEA